jgi:glucose-6-phosphate-specific signal transduction histidine kinase
MVEMAILRLAVAAEAIRAGSSGHWGLLGMRERAHKVGATLTIDSRTSGTRIERRVPSRSAFAARKKGLLHNFLSRSDAR